MKIFSITFNGDIRELEDDDLNILTKFTITDLDRNRSKIAFKILKGHEFCTDEINNWYNEFENDWTRTKGNTRTRFTGWLKNRGFREKKLHDIMYALGNLKLVDEMLRCHSDIHTASIASILRIVEGISKNDRHTRIRCVDKDNIIEHFPGYFEKKELWDYWKEHSVAYDIFIKTIRGEYPNYLRDYNQKDIGDAWM